MANNLIQVKRTSVSGRAANSTTLPNPGELALNMADGILYSTNGSNVFEIGANNTNAAVTNTLTVNAISANGGVGANNQSLTSNGSSVYWKDPLIKDLTDVAANGATDTQVLTYNSTLNKWINQNPPVANVVYTTGYYGVFYDTTTQRWATGGSNTAVVTAIPTTYLSNGLTRTANDEIQVGYAGVYQFQFSLQFTSSSNKNETIWVWLRKNGTDIPDSATDFGIYPVAGGANGYVVAVTPLVDVASAGDKYQVMWAVSSNSTVSLVTLANTAFAPATPGTIISVIPVSNIITAPPGGNTQVSFNDSGLANGSAGLTFTKTTNSVFVANNLYVGNVANAQAFTVDGTFWANSTVVNSVSFQVDGSFTANSTMVNAAALLVRGDATVNGTLTLNDGLSANGGVGSSGQVLFTDGTKAYWNTVAAGVNTDAQYVWSNAHTFQDGLTFNNTVTLGNSTVNGTINSTSYTGTANSTNYVGSVSAANVVSNAQLSGNLANYQTTAGLASNVATLTSNNSSYAFGKTESELYVRSANGTGVPYYPAYQLNSLTTYVDGLDSYHEAKTDVQYYGSNFALTKEFANSSIMPGYTAGNSYAYMAVHSYIEAAIAVENDKGSNYYSFRATPTSFSLTEYTTADTVSVSANAYALSVGNSSVNVTINSTSFSGVSNDTTYAFGKTEGALNVNSAIYANDSTYAFGKSEGDLNVNSATYATTANNSTYAFGKTEDNLNVNSAINANNSTYVYGKTEGNLNVNSAATANYASYINANTGLVSNASGVFVNAAYINTLGASSLGGVAADYYVQNTDSRVLSGNLQFTGANVVVNTQITVNNAVINSSGVYATNLYGNLTGNVAATTISGNLTGNVSATTISGNLTGNVSATTVNATTINATANIVVGANVLVNTTTLAIGNSTANVYVNSTAFVGNVVATSISGNLTGNVVATTISGNLTGNVLATTVNATTINATTFQVGTNFTANSSQVVAADLLVTGNLVVNGSTVTLNTATLDVKDLNITLAKGVPSAAAANGAGITVDGANATILYSSAGNSFVSNVIWSVGNSTVNVYTNSTAFVGNVVATTITGNLTGNVAATTITGNLAGAVTASGNVIFNANVSVTGVIANGSLGTNGQVLKTNASAAYWANYSFIGLSDVPSTYSGYAGYLLAVDAGGTSVGFTNDISIDELIHTARIAPTTVASDSVTVYVTASGVSPNREVAYKIKNQSGEEVILSSVLV